MPTPGLLIAGADSWCFVFSLLQFSKSDLLITSQVFSSHSLLSPTFSLLPGWRTGNALDVARHSSEQHFIAAFCSAGAVSIVTFLNGASRRPETLFPGPGFPPGGRRPIDAVTNGVAKANGKNCGGAGADGAEDGGESSACAWDFERCALWLAHEAAWKL
jgi:hypothetical protein